MGILRGIANVVTLGATSKVDAAAESYRRTVSRYEEYRNLGQNIKNLQMEAKQLKSDLKSKSGVIKKIYTNPETRGRLSSIEIKALEEYKKCSRKLSVTPRFSSNIISFWDWEDTAPENLSIILATTLIPIAGVFGAHSNADVKVAEIQSKEKEVLDAIRKIQPQVIKMQKIKRQYELSIKTLSIVKSIVERYGDK